VVTFKTLKELYRKEIPITMLTAYDFATARMIGMATTPSQSEEKGPSSSELPSGIDICLCGDSLANVCLGYQSTTELEVDEFVYHLKAIRRGLDSLKAEPDYRIPLFIADLPFGTYEASVEQGVRTATRLVQAARVDGLKIEGGKELRPLIERLSSFGMPVIGHIGLTPQRASSLGGFKVQGHDCPSKAREIIADALELERAGCVAIVIEAVPVELISHLKKLLKVPLIGIGAGPQTDGQVLVTSDLIGALGSHSPLLKNLRPKFVPNFSSSVKLDHHSLSPAFDLSLQIIRSYVHLVRTRQFPKIGLHTYSMKADVLQHLNQHGWSS
jgi:3-methyl-2-oxobutanoate hydroxymethyltransferase